MQLNVHKQDFLENKAHEYVPAVANTACCALGSRGIFLLCGLAPNLIPKNSIIFPFPSTVLSGASDLFVQRKFMKLHSCYIPSPLTKDMKLLEGRKDTVIYMREQVEEGREELQAGAAVSMWHFEFSSRTRTLLSHHDVRDLGLHQ